MSMTCPICEGELQLVDTKGHYGGPMVVERCAGCLGFWLEAMTAIGVGHQGALALEGDADFSKMRVTPRSDFRACPQCRMGLEETTGGDIPQGLHVDRCPKCGGMWFDRGELLVYKSAFEAKKQKKQQKRLEEERKKLFEPSHLTRSNAAHPASRMNQAIEIMTGLL